ncbi:hypothetical protein, partial [Escherichia coli]|uniref:hypothetical protein n=1 Tax=Escherichia coli TaxID=562 RepID=UPI001BDB6D67
GIPCPFKPLSDGIQYLWIDRAPDPTDGRPAVFREKPVDGENRAPPLIRHRLDLPLVPLRHLRAPGVDDQNEVALV